MFVRMMARVAGGLGGMAGLVGVAVIGVAVAFSSLSAQTLTVTGRATVVDGDTLHLHVAGNRITVRLAGIDAPESRQMCRLPSTSSAQPGSLIPCGERATEALRRLVGQNEVSCTRIDTDRYGRMVGTCVVRVNGRSGVNLNEQMLREGWAVVYMARRDANLLALQEQARRERRGIWATEFVEPAEWRRQNRN